MCTAILVAVLSAYPAQPPNEARHAVKGFHPIWWNLARYPDDPIFRARILNGGETALEALIDLLCGEDLGEPPDAEKVAAIVEQLGAVKFRDREKAHRELVSFGAVVLPLLKRHANHPDAEVRRRVAGLLTTLSRVPPEEGLFLRLESIATSLLETRFPLDQIQNVARRNVRRMAQVEQVNGNWGERPLGPLFASLRMSANVQDRDLLAQVLPKAKDGAAEVLLSVMRDGISTRTVRVAEHWKKLPRHDYRAAALKLLDPARPTVCIQAIYTAQGHPKFVSHLHALLDKPMPARVYEVVTFVLWCYYADSKARDVLVRDLNSEDDERFDHALCTLTDHTRQYEGAQIIPKLRPILRGNNAKRRLQTLERLDRYLGKQSIELAAGEAARFLTSIIVEERQTAERVLKRLHETRWLDVYGLLQQKGETESIRQAAAELAKVNATKK